MKRKNISWFKNILAFCGFPVTFWLINFYLGRNFQDWCCRLVSDRLTPELTSEAYIQKQIKTWSRMYKKFKDYKFIIFEADYEDIIVKGHENINLSTRIFRQEQTAPWVIISHAWTQTKFEVMHIADVYYHLGFNVVIYDMRAHGLSAKPGLVCTIGYLEKYDLIMLIRHLHEKYLISGFILHGQSLGGAVAIEAAKRIDPIHRHLLRGVVVDGCFDYLEKQLLNFAQDRYKLSQIFYRQGIRWAFWKRQKFTLAKVNPAKDLDLINDLPLLIIHGNQDHVVPLTCGQNILKNKQKTEKQKHSFLHLVPKGRHVLSMQADPPAFQTAIIELIKLGGIELADY